MSDVLPRTGKETGKLSHGSFPAINTSSTRTLLRHGGAVDIAVLEHDVNVSGSRVDVHTLSVGAAGPGAGIRGQARAAWVPVDAVICIDGTDRRDDRVQFIREGRLHIR